jgi:hypothetical protein
MGYSVLEETFFYPDEAELTEVFTDYIYLECY